MKNVMCLKIMSQFKSYLILFYFIVLFGMTKVDSTIYCILESKKFKLINNKYTSIMGQNIL